MAKAKSLGSDVALDQKSDNQDKTLNLKRVINAGVEVNLSMGTYRVREMPGADFLLFLLESVELVQAILGGSGDGLQAIRVALKDAQVKNKINEFFALSLGIDSSEVDLSKLTLSDYVVLIAACKQAYDWETLQAGFTELGLMETIQGFLSSTNQEAQAV